MKDNKNYESRTTLLQPKQIFLLILVPIIFVVESLQLNNLLQASFISILLLFAIVSTLVSQKRKNDTFNVETKNNWEEYYSILELIPDTVIIHQNGIIKFINDTGAKTLGPDTPVSFVGKSLIDFIHPDSKKQARKRISLLKESTILNLSELKAINLSGDEINLETTSSTIHYVDQSAILTIARNISTNKKTEFELIDNELKYRTLFEYANDAIYLFELDDDGMPLNFVEINQVASIRFGYSKEELLNMSPLDITSVTRFEHVYETQQKLLMQGHITFEGEYISKLGRRIPSEINVRVLTLHGKRLALAISRDISERKKAEGKIRRLAYYDSLTNVANRSYFRLFLSKTLEEAPADNYQMALLYIDLDRFKSVNDTFGHHVGDRLLVEVSKRLTNCISKNDLVARQGGDEFIILLKDTNQVNVRHLSEKISRSLGEPFFIEGNKIFTTPSIGISFFPFDGVDTETLIKNADTAMYVAKGSNEYTYQYYSLDMNHKKQRKMLLEMELRTALQRNELQLYYQPKIDIHSQKLVGVEALLRWNSSKLGKVSPAEFIPVAEETGLIISIGEWVLKTACKQCKTWHDKGYPTINMSINLSARQFQQSNLIQFVSKTLIETQLDPKYINLEITETMAMINIEESIFKLKELKDLGVSISLDDFGTGYSSLSYLKRFPVDVLKIDQAFIRDIMADEQSAAIVKAIISVSKSLNLTVIAEGVETLEELNFLKEKKCDEVQGYYFSPPIPAVELERFIRKVNI